MKKLENNLNKLKSHGDLGTANILIPNRFRVMDPFSRINLLTTQISLVIKSQHNKNLKLL